MVMVIVIVIAAVKAHNQRQSQTPSQSPCQSPVITVAVANAVFVIMISVAIWAQGLPLSSACCRGLGGSPTHRSCQRARS
eukprot:11194640-Lingulodinium_polyedra.AAC.1